MIKLLIVDDSPLMRRLLTSLFTEAGDFTVETARSGEEAVDKLASVQPDVVTLDINMPGMDGLACLDRIMLERPCPVVMVSALTTEGAEETLAALALGAVDFVPKPLGALSLELESGAQQLVETVRAASRATVSRAARLTERVRLQRTRVVARTAEPAVARRFVDPMRASAKHQLVLIGCSTGGPPALDAVLGALPANFAAPIVIAQHMPASFTGPLARRLDRLCSIAVSELAGLAVLEPGHAYVARGDHDVIITRRRDALAAMPAPTSPEHHWHPSVDRMVNSALTTVAAKDLVCVLLTGMGSDGASAMAQVKAQGGRTIAESRDTAVVWGMPGALVQADGANVVAPLPEIGPLLASLLR